MRRTIDEVRAELEARRSAYEKQKRERRRRLLYTAPVLTLALVIATTLLPWGDWFSPVSPPESPHPVDPPKSSAPEEPQEPLMPDMPTSPDAPLHGSASYCDGVNSFEELLEAADLIVVGTVVSTDTSSPLTETARVRIETVYRAPEGVPSEIALYQMKDSHTASVGCRYLLFLKVQTEGETDAFYSIGGGQGTIGYTNGHVSGTSPVIDADEVIAWLAQVKPIE